jgi:TolB protein
MKPRFFLTAVALMVQTLMSSAATDDSVIITKVTDSMGFLKPVPVAVTGFGGEADAVLRNDLLFMGFKFVPPAEARFLITGNTAGRLEARVIDQGTKRQVLGKAYSNGTLRQQVHAFADEVATTLTGLPGIAQTKIAYKAEAGLGKSEVYIADYDGFGSVAATRDGSMVLNPCWVGKGSVVYGSYKLGNPYIFSQELGTGQRRTVSRQPGDNYSPAVSKDGRRIAMILNKAGNPDLYVMNMDGSGLKQLTKTREAESSPCWSPDGRTICFVSREGGPAGLYLISPEGGSRRRLATGGSTCTEPDWSPDGKWIAFTRQSRGFEICMVPAQGGPVYPLVQGEDPSWAPNSRALIYCTGPDHGKRLSLLDVPTLQHKTLARVLESNSQPSWAK